MTHLSGTDRSQLLLLLEAIDYDVGPFHLISFGPTGPLSGTFHRSKMKRRVKACICGFSADPQD
ncbi:hypothetical protein [Rhizobium rhizogenes]|uniref:hypothetical protein n=1 Tax=Rhizobium rhizogenes TaxID=359 RepID=UPI00115F0C3A|nr:hypothetical protein [Rhizobium rhizogenes]QCL10516.1 hypothetical protein pC6.5c_623 [Rhizobium rhizogenes]TRB17111.1 hypothetical protein EXN70_31910 [Rhizobium rhizogenes]